MAIARFTSPLPIAVDATAALEGMTTGVLVIDASGRAIFANAQVRKWLTPVDPIDLQLDAILKAASRFGLLSKTQSLNLMDWFADAGPGVCHVQFSHDLNVAATLVKLTNGHRLIELTDITQQQKAAEIAFRDPLTGLANRAEFQQRLQEAIARNKRNGEAATVLCVDLDRFKAINDTLGHPMGDALLKAVADRIRGVLRPDDVVARIGGDEFVILQPGGPLLGASEALATRLIDLISRAYVIKGHMLNIGASIGAATLPADGLDPDQLLKHADLALYRAKADGRGVFRFFEPDMNARMQARRSLEIDLRRALAAREFELAFQPQVNADGGVLVGFEALIRWRHAERGMVPPAEFIPLAEEIGLIIPIGEWVLRTACIEAAGWDQPLALAVNLSAMQFRGGGLVGTVTSALAASGLCADRLELEITEGALLQDTASVLATLHEIRVLGVKISMDDFGTGYSSLSYLQKFPFSKIKIDQSFVRAMIDDPDCAAIVRAVAALGASLGMKTTAEGVETEEQLAQVRLEGCSEVQGYLTGRPLTATDAANLAGGAQPTIIKGDFG